ncbi:MAG TPA: hypothetical protein VIL36_01575, partial [Acidimicrobiales bacterium]
MPTTSNGSSFRKICGSFSTGDRSSCAAATLPTSASRGPSDSGCPGSQRTSASIVRTSPVDCPSSEIVSAGRAGVARTDAWSASTRTAASSTPANRRTRSSVSGGSPLRPGPPAPVAVVGRVPGSVAAWSVTSRFRRASNRSDTWDAAVCESPR